jgi:hypothetical protein
MGRGGQSGVKACNRACELLAKHEAMKEHGDRSDNSSSQFILAPGYPFSGQELLADLRFRIAAEEGHQLGFAELGRLMGQSKSTVHFWFSSYRHPHLIAFMSLLERLSPAQRQAFIEAHCRVLPLLSDGSFVGEIAKLRDLLAKSAGLTVISGYSDKARMSVSTAFGNSWRRLHRKEGGPVGIDIHRPKDFVPSENMRCIDETLDQTQIRELVLSAWPKLATSRTQLLLANGLWSSVPGIRNDLLLLARYKHVVLVEQTIPDFTASREDFPEFTHIVSLSRAFGTAIRITCGRAKSPKCR